MGQKIQQQKYPCKLEFIEITLLKSRVFPPALRTSTLEKEGSTLTIWKAEFGKAFENPDKQWT